MALSTKDILKLLSEWPERRAGSEAELMAREAVMARLMGEYGIEVKEEGIYAPQNLRIYGLIIFTVFIVSIVLLWFSPFIAMMSILLIAFIVYRFVIGHTLPFASMFGAKITANLISGKGSGETLILFVAPFDTYQDAYSEYMPAGFGEGYSNKDIKLAVNTATVSRLWRERASDMEIRLCLTSGSVAANTGLDQYIQHHRDDFDNRRLVAIACEEKDILPLRTVGFECHYLDSMNDRPTALSNTLEAIALEFIEV
jgi:hypothetical protein